MIGVAELKKAQSILQQTSGAACNEEETQVLEKIWLPPRDSNPDMLIQSQLSCR